MTLESVAHPPAELLHAPDIRVVDPRAELERCARLLRWIESLPTEAVISSQRPSVADDLVSVVVPMFNAAAWIESCVKGVLAQTHRNLEVFCIDDCSSDDTYERVVDLFGRDGRVCAVKLARNVGQFQISNWVGGSLARGRRIAWQDADNVSHPMRIEAQCRWMDAHRFRVTGACAHHFFPLDIAPFYPDASPLDADDRLHELVVYKTYSLMPLDDLASPDGWEHAWQRNMLGPAEASQRGTDVPAFRYFYNGVCLHGSETIDTELFREFGGYQGVTKLIEDSDLQWRLSRFYDVGNLPRVLSSRRSHSESLTRHHRTGLASSARQDARVRGAARRARITAELERGNARLARELCTERLHRGEIDVARAHCGFDVALS